MGKGGAVRQGALRARGEMVLMADADGATRFGDGLERLYTGMDSLRRLQSSKSLHTTTPLHTSSSAPPTPAFMGIVVGSRAHMHENRASFRQVLTLGFHFCVSVLVPIGEVIDTQCGFKLFSRRAAQVVFPRQHLERWAFDCELLFLARELGIPVKEEAVQWSEVADTKLNFMLDSPKMLMDLVKMRAMYLLGFWRVEEGLI